MSGIIYAEVKSEIKTEVKEYNEISSALIVDPKAIRETLLGKEPADVLTRIAEHIVFIGPRPDRVTAKLNTRVAIKTETLNKINQRIQDLSSFIKKHSIRATQFQAAFPDLILKIRDNVNKNKGVLQRFVPDSILPLLYQFPGSGPVVPDEFRGEDHYGAFNIALTKALSQNQQDVNWTIVNKSLEWSIVVVDDDDEKEKLERKSKTPKTRKDKI